jgi:hypothetical protein
MNSVNQKTNEIRNALYYNISKVFHDITFPLHRSTEKKLHNHILNFMRANINHAILVPNKIRDISFYEKRDVL